MLRIPTPAWLAAAAVFVTLAAFGGRYGYHRDELYFIEAGHHLAWAQPDQPIGVPLLATGWHTLVGGSLWGFRLLPALVSAATVLTGALTARTLGGDARRQGLASVAVALTSIVLGTGHLFSTTTFDILGTALTLWLLVRAVAHPASLTAWLGTGLVAGLSLEIKTLLLFVLASCLVGLLALGPREVLRRPGPYLAAAVMVLLAAPNLMWQALHGWPMLAISSSIASGASTSSVPRGLLVPMVALMLSPLLAVVAACGLVWLLRRRQRHAYGWLAVGFLVFLAFTIATGGKAYYPAGFFPALLAAGAMALPPLRKAVVIPLAVVNTVPVLWFDLPIAPVGSTPFRIAAAVNPDSAETVGWPAVVDAIRGVTTTLPDEQRAGSVVLAGNYGEAGAVALARHQGVDLPPVYSGHNAFGQWGPPPESATTVVVVGWFAQADLDRWFVACHDVATLRSPPGVDNDEVGAPVRVCTQLRRPWEEIWPQVRRLG